MKPLLLEISGLNSFRQRERIEFDRLTHDGLFGIFGPTGSGKSSILDAITLALYGKVKRAPGGRGGVINAREQQCAVSFRFEVGVGDERRRYTVERLLARSKSEGIQTKKARLIDATEDPPVTIAEKQSEVDRRVEEIVGINAEDFLRAVVLPQGSFAEFLFLTPKDRASALQRLFGLHDLGQRLSGRLKSRSLSLKESRAEIGGGLAELRAYDDEILALREREMNDAVARQEDARRAREIAEKRLEETRVLHELFLEQSDLRHRDAHRDVREMTLRTLRARIELAERSRTAEPAIIAYRSALDRHGEAEREYAAAVREKAGADAKLDTAREHHVREKGRYDAEFESLCGEIARLKLIGHEKEQLLAKRDELRGLNDALRSAGAELEEKERLHTASAGRLAEGERLLAEREEALRRVTISADERSRNDELRGLVREIERATKQIAESESRLRTKTRDRDLAGADLNKAIDEVDAAERRLGTLRAALDTARAAHEGALNEVSALRDELSRVKLGIRQIEGIDERIAGLERDVDAAVKALSISQSELEDARLRLKNAGEDERKIREERDRLAVQRESRQHRVLLASLAARLEQGDPCPLCGAADHPSLCIPDESTDASALEAEWSAADASFRAAEALMRECERDVAALTATMEGEQKQVESRRGTLEAARLERQSLLDTVGDLPAGASLDDARTRADRITERGLHLKSVADDGARRIAELERDIAAATRESMKAGERRAALTRQTEMDNRGITDLGEELAALRADLSTMTARFSSIASGRSIPEVKADLDRLTSNERQADALREETGELQKEIRAARRDLDMIDTELRRVQTEKDGLERDVKKMDEEARKIAADLERRLNEIIPERERGARVEKLLEDREARRDTMERRYREAESAYQEASTASRLAAGRVDDRAKDLHREERYRDEQGRACAEALALLAFDSIDAARAGLLDGAELSRITEQANALDHDLRFIRERLIELDAKITGRTISAEEIAAIEKECAAARDTDEECVKGLAVARNRYEECREKNGDYHRLMDRERDIDEQAATVRQLEKYLLGDAFVNFLAEERLAEVCRRASQQLRTLTNGRLELLGAKHDEGFLIRDNGNGGVERATSSLSGGETFLVSLSLALALSDTIQLGHAPLEFFFLDEGFGTLDSDLLDMVMNSLDRLRSKHRAIGVITHVTGLRERIPRRLIVAPPDDERGTTVRYELA